MNTTEKTEQPVSSKMEELYKEELRKLESINTEETKEETKELSIIELCYLIKKLTEPKN